MKKFSAFLNESLMSSIDIVRYITNNTPNDSDIPDYFLAQIKKSGRKFELKTLKIDDLLRSDESLKEYVDSKEERYGDDSESSHVPRPNDVYEPIVVVDGVVMDGYSRTSRLFWMGETEIEAYVAI